jgi:BirA family biotin operon repressor/biotin-[acetyl-CoA-carboxylase] ligase
MIMGIGLNLRHADSTNNALPKASAFGVAALDQLAADSLAVPDIEYIWLKLIESLEKHITEFDLHGFTHFKHTWAQWDAFNGTPVCISGAGVDESGALLLKQHDETITIHSGDISLRVQS